MHMSDALLSPTVGATFWLVSAVLIGQAARHTAKEADPAKTPLMGVLGAFVFAAQMINFTIPGTGSSGHLGGGLLLTVLLGPWRAFLTLASVLLIQCLFFADGGLLALGSNIFNLAFFPAFVAWPLVYRRLVGPVQTPARLALATLTSAVLGLLLGALAVVVQTTLSGISELPFRTFALFMLPIHLAIGVVEGLVTWGVLRFAQRVQPALLSGNDALQPPRTLVAGLGLVAVLVGGLLSWTASEHPDGLEWSIQRVTGQADLEAPPSALTQALASAQAHTALLPDYGLASSPDNPAQARLGTSLSGLLGSLAVLVVALGLGTLLRARPRTPEKAS